MTTLAAPTAVEPLRRFWPALASLLVLALLSSVHSLVFAPLGNGVVESRLEVARVFLKRSGGPS
jgi:hypothetical protein